MTDGEIEWTHSEQAEQRLAELRKYASVTPAPTRADLVAEAQVHALLAIHEELSRLRQEYADRTDS